jgi:phosphoglycerate dehydrogenase-like enzyme
MCTVGWGDMFERLRGALSECTVLACKREELLDFVPDADVLIPAMTPLDRQVIAATGAKLIQQCGVGLDGVDIATASERGIFVANVPSAGSGNAESVAELAIFFMVALARRLPDALNNFQTQRWAQPLGTTLYGKTVGIIGMGNIGRTLAERLQPFGVRLLGIKRTPDENLQRLAGLEWLGDPTEMGYLLGRSDFVVLCATLNASSYHLIGAAQLARMQRHAFLINVGRGALLDRDALEVALREGRIAGAGLDVYWEEPVDPADPIFRYNVIALPHVGSVTDTSAMGIARAVAENVRRVARGERPLNCVNPDCQKVGSRG